MKKLLFIVIVVLIGFCSKINAQSITFKGFKCLNPINSEDSAQTDIAIESRFEVLEVLGDGMFRL